MKKQKSVMRSLALVTQLGLGIMAPVFLCILAGSFLDSRYGTKTMLWLIILGFLAGGRNGWMLVQSILKQDEEDENDGGDDADDQREHEADP